MTVARGMVLAALISWLAVAIVARETRAATFFGMIAPLAVAVVVVGSRPSALTA
jgi:hypothetical protein